MIITLKRARVYVYTQPEMSDKLKWLLKQIKKK